MKLVKEVAEAVEAKKEKDAGGCICWYMYLSCMYGVLLCLLAMHLGSTAFMDGVHQPLLVLKKRTSCLLLASAGKPSRDSGTSHEQQYVRQVIELHDKYLAYVSTCFANSSLFHKALKEAFEGFCNKNVAGSTSAELMANFCDNLLKKVRLRGFLRPARCTVLRARCRWV
jgi:hypothetical protein